MEDEAKKELLEAEWSNRFVNSEDFIKFREKLTSIMAISDSISTVDTNQTNEVVGEAVKVRKLAQQLVISWLQEVEGQAEIHQAYHRAMEQTAPPMVNY